MTVLSAIALYLAFGALFLVAWCRGLPPAENTSRAIDREMRRRNCGDLPRVPVEFILTHKGEGKL